MVVAAAMDDQHKKDLADMRTVHAVLTGNREAFREIVDRYSTPIYSLAYRFTGSVEDSEELVQEIFWKAFSRLSSFDTDRRFFPWLYTIALNHIRSRERSPQQKQQSDSVSLDTTLQFVLPSDTKDEPERALERQEADDTVAAAIASLRQEYRDVFVLRHMEGFSGKEVAEMLEIPENTVKTYAFRARKELRAFITKSNSERLS